MSNESAQPLPQAGAERTLEAVGCSALFGMESPPLGMASDADPLI